MHNNRILYNFIDYMHKCAKNKSQIFTIDFLIDF